MTALPNQINQDIKTEADRLWNAIADHNVSFVIRILGQFNDNPQKTRELCQYEVNKIVFSVKPRQLKDDFTCFHFAAKKGQVEVVKAMLNKSEDLDVNLKSSTLGWTPFHHAIFAGHANVVRCLVAYKADINARAENGFTPLHVAISKGHRKMAGYLCVSHCDLNAADANGNTPLHLCLDINILQDTGWTEENRTEMVDVLLMKGSSVSVANRNGDTPIHFACRSDVDEHCLALLTSVPDAEKTRVAENMSGHVPLHLAESPYAIRMLLEKGANPNVQAADQRTALHMRVNNSESVHILLKHGADPYLKDRQNRTALHVAMTSESPDIQSLRHLLKVMTNVNMGDNAQDTPLHLACVKDFTGPHVRPGEKSCPILLQLLSRGADVNVQNRRGQTPIFCAIKYKQHPKAHLLMEYGADPDIEDVRGKSARDLDVKFFNKHYKNVLPSEEEILAEKYFQSPTNPVFNKKNARRKKPPPQESKRSVQETKKPSSPVKKKEAPLPKWVEDHSQNTLQLKSQLATPSVNSGDGKDKITLKISQSSISVEINEEDKFHRNSKPGMFNLLPTGWLDSIPDEETPENKDSNTTKGKENKKKGIVTLSRELTRLHEEVDEVKQFLEEFSSEGENTPQHLPAPPPPPLNMMPKRERAMDIGTSDRQITSLRDDVKNVAKCLEEISGQ